MNRLEKLLQEKYNVDMKALVDKHGPDIVGGLCDEHKAIIEALAIACVGHYNSGDAAGWLGAAKVLFAIGYEAGKSAPDLSVFEDILNDGE